MGKTIIGLRNHRLRSNYGLMLCIVVLLYWADALTSLGFRFLIYQKGIIISALPILTEFWRGSKDIKIIVN